tara:strand:+ start:108 stop:380 length:273 start_codon:yes stop_codon:yes gene_type:complete
MPDFATSNLSKIKPKFRTQGRVSGNFGKNKVRAGANTTLGLTDAAIINIVTQDNYLNRMYEAFNKTDDDKLKYFCYTEIRNILIQRGIWS